MQYQKSQKGFGCFKCGQEMQGYSINYHHYECLNCGTELKGLAVRADQGFEQLIGAIYILGLFFICLGILKGTS